MFCIKDDKERSHLFHSVKRWWTATLPHPPLSPSEFTLIAYAGNTSALVGWSYICWIGTVNSALSVTSAQRKKKIKISNSSVETRGVKVPRLLTSCKAKSMDGPLLSNLPLQCCFSHCLGIFVELFKLFAFYLSVVLLCPCPGSTVGLLPECQAEGWLDVVRTGLCSKTPSRLRALEWRFPWQPLCSALIFFDVCALSKLVICCHQYTAFRLHYCFNQSSGYDSICCVL